MSSVEVREPAATGLGLLAMPGAAQGLTGKLLSFLGLPGKSPPESHLLWWSRWSARVLWNTSTNLTSCHPWQQSPENNSFLCSDFHISQECLSPWPRLTWNRMGKGVNPGNVISDVSEMQKDVVVMLSWGQTVHKYRNLL